MFEKEVRGIVKRKIEREFWKQSKGKKKFEKYNVSFMKFFIYLNFVLEELIQQRKEQR